MVIESRIFLQERKYSIFNLIKSGYMKQTQHRLIFNIPLLSYLERVYITK